MVLSGTRFLTLALTCLLAGAVVADSELSRQDTPGAQVPKSNICFGGLEDGKLIPHDGKIHNHFRQTSELGCTVDGGRAVFMPDLAPLISEGKLA